MRIDDYYRLDSDKNCVTLYFEKETGEVNKKGNPVVSKDQWYFPNLKMALKYYVQQKLSDDLGGKGIKKILSEIRRIEEKINSL